MVCYRFVIERNLEFLGHVIREEGLEKLSIEVKIDGSTTRGRQRQALMI